MDGWPSQSRLAVKNSSKMARIAEEQGYARECSWIEAATRMVAAGRKKSASDSKPRLVFFECKIQTQKGGEMDNEAQTLTGGALAGQQGGARLMRTSSVFLSM